MADRPRWDCHAHVIGHPERFPLSPGREYEPPRAEMADYLSVLDRLRLDRGLLVQPSVYGFDNSCLLDALRRGGGRLAGVAVPDPGASFGELEALHRAGVRGIRCNLVNPGGLPPEAAIEWEPFLREKGWHVAFQVRVDAEGTLAPLLDRFDVPVVVDHMGRPSAGAVDPSAPGCRELVALVEAGRCFVKLSAPYRMSTEGQPWRDVAPLARALVAANARACLWATDWPHTQHPGRVEVRDLWRAFEEWCPDPSLREAILRETPARLMA